MEGYSGEHKYGLKKVGKFVTDIVEIKTLPKEANIGYGNFYQTKKETTVAVLQVGYADGVGLNLQEQLFKTSSKLRTVCHALKSFTRDYNIKVTIKDKQYPILGQVGMYHIIVDITGEDFKVGDKAELDIRPIYVDRIIRREYI